MTFNYSPSADMLVAGKKRSGSIHEVLHDAGCRVSESLLEDGGVTASEPSALFNMHNWPIG